MSKQPTKRELKEEVERLTRLLESIFDVAYGTLNGIYLECIEEKISDIEKYKLLIKEIKEHAEDALGIEEEEFNSETGGIQ